MYVNNQSDTKGINKVKTSCLFQKSQTRENGEASRAAKMGKGRREEEKKGWSLEGGLGNR
jgi:hypothetical protein